MIGSIGFVRDGQTLSVRWSSFIFFYGTFGWTTLNICAALIPSLSLLFVFLRDSWVFLFLLWLLSSRKRADLALLAVLICLTAIGSVAIIDYGLSVASLQIIFYGFRDLCLVGLIYNLLTQRCLHVSVKTIEAFVAIVFVIFFAEVISQLVGLHSEFARVFNLERYYEAKGVSISLQGGLFGARPGLPLYSPSLVAALLASFVLLQRPVRGKWLFFVMSSLTLSKVVIFYLLMRIFRPIYVSVIIAAFLSLPALVLILEGVKESYPNTLYSMHASSIIEHVSPLSYVRESDFSVLPDLLGSSSILASVIVGADSSHAPESLVMARLLDFNMMFPLLILGLCAATFRLSGVDRYLFICFIGLMYLTGMANHPVVFLPTIFLFKSLEYSKTKEAF